MAYKPRYYDRDRIAGIQLANKLGATRTAAAIEDQTKDFKDIFDTALAELGLDKVASELLQHSPVWAHAALLFVPDWGPYRQALLKRAAEAPDGTIGPAIGTKRISQEVTSKRLALNPALMGGPLSKMMLNNYMAADCRWTIEWFDGNAQPAATYPNWRSWNWSPTLTAGCSSTMSVLGCKDRVPDCPLRTGDVVWIYVSVDGGSDKNGKDNLPSFQFTYDSGSPASAIFGISGTTTNNTLSVVSYPTE